MYQRNWRNLIIILILVAISIWIALPNNPGIRILGMDKDIETRLGLDLDGGVQALLEADLPEGTTVDESSMNTAVTIVENRVNGLGINEALVQKAGDNRIVVELPGETDPDEALALLRTTGLLEFVDFSMYDSTAAVNFTGQTIATDYAPPGGEPEEVTEGQRVYHTVMTGVEIDDARVSLDPSNNFVVEFSLKSAGASVFREWTSANVGSPLAIVLDKKVVSAPSVSQPITDGQGLITGRFTQEEADNLAVVLRYGSLPIPLKVVETRTISPTLGEDSLNKSILAGAIGFTIVILFMGLYYRLPGVVANLVIIMYALMAFALFRYIPVTLTLPGIAGFMLSTGSALDANILIFERLKEELRSGRSIRQSLELAFQRAWPSIRDSNIATLFTCAVLFWFGSQFGATIVKGFALTLALGVGISVFSALFITRNLLTLVLNYFQPENKERWFGI